MRGCKNSTSSFGPYPNKQQIRRLIVVLSRLTRWGLRAIRCMTWQDACIWLDEAAKYEREFRN